MPFDAAWCPDCRRLREASAISDPEPWLGSYDDAIVAIGERESVVSE